MVVIIGDYVGTEQRDVQYPEIENCGGMNRAKIKVKLSRDDTKVVTYAVHHHQLL